MTKQMIEVDIPEGYEFVRYGLPEQGDYYLGLEGHSPTFAERDSEYYMYNRIILKKKQPERIIFEHTKEKRKVLPGEYYSNDLINILFWDGTFTSRGEHYILTKVEE